VTLTPLSIDRGVARTHRRFYVGLWVAFRGGLGIVFCLLALDCS